LKDRVDKVFLSNVAGQPISKRSSFSKSKSLQDPLPNLNSHQSNLLKRRKYERKTPLALGRGFTRTAARLGQICGNEILDSKGSFEEQ